MPKSLNPIMCAMGWLRTSIKTVPQVISLANTYCEIFPHAINAPYPSVGLSEVRSEDVYVGLTGDNSDIIMTQCDISVVVVNKSPNPANIAGIYKDIHSRLHMMFDVPGGDMGDLGKVLSCVRVKPIYYTDRDKEDNVWQYLGGVYRLVVE